MRNVTFQALPAKDIDHELARQISVLLGRAYTDERHRRAFAAEDLQRWRTSIEAAHASPPHKAPQMPEDFLRRFPTLRNLHREPHARRESIHVVSRESGFVACHVAVFPHCFVLDGDVYDGAYIEDVATDPERLNRGLATSAMALAVEAGASRGARLMALATGIEPFYERLGWRTWRGEHEFRVIGREGWERDEPLMLLAPGDAPLPDDERFPLMRSWRLAKFGERPEWSTATDSKG
jgi:GNAT superfamily N-acetyltransferase